MRDTAFVICEYNPFHNGHLRHLQTVRSAGAKRIVCLMSGNFVQRGDIAFCDKITRAGFALRGGADLVAEIPVKYVLSGASNYALGAALMMRETGIAGTLSFGASAPAETLADMAAYLRCPKITAQIMADSQQNGITYASAVKKAASHRFAQADTLLSDPNNVLALEYIKALFALDMDTELFSVERTGAAHDADTTDRQFASAKWIREAVYGKRDLNGVKPFVPPYVYDTLALQLEERAAPADRDRFSAAVFARLLTVGENELSAVNGVTQGLENRILSCIRTSGDLASLYDNVKTKRFTHARIRQALISAALGIQKNELETGLSYFRVLGMNETGRGLIREIRSKTAVPVVMNLSEAPNCAQKQTDYLCGKLFALCRPKSAQGNAEYETKPYVVS